MQRRSLEAVVESGSAHCLLFRAEAVVAAATVQPPAGAYRPCRGAEVEVVKRSDQ